MKKGITILVGWLIAAMVIDTFIVPHSIPHNGIEIFCDRLTIIFFPWAAWFYARHSSRISPVFCYGLIAGVFSIYIPLSFFYDARGMPREITILWKIAIVGVPILMAAVCAGVFALRRFLDGKNEPN
jgi:hypothetical protein